MSVRPKRGWHSAQWNNPGTFQFSDDIKAKLSGLLDTCLIPILEAETANYIEWRDARDGAPSGAQIRAALEEIVDWADRGREIFWQLDSKTYDYLLITLHKRGDTELIHGLEQSLQSMSNAAFMTAQELPKTRRGRPANSHRLEFACCVGDHLAKAGYQLSATRKTEATKESLFVSVIRVLFESTGENFEPHSLAYEAILKLQ